jgi:organic radical activating enzyme
MDLSSIYISPLEQCNLSCRYCYTKKTKNILTNEQILSFVKKYQALADLKSIIFCGGEVFTLPKFTDLINKLLDQHLFITIITNGTIDKLDQIKDPHNCQLIVSFDGPQQIHDQNRGQGNFLKSQQFVNSALQKGFPVEIFYLITQDSYPYKDKLNIFNLPITYLTDRLGSLTDAQIKDIRQNYPCYPPRNFGCSMLSLQSDGKFYGCCESVRPLGSLADPFDKIINNYLKVYNPICSDPDFHCQLT